MTTAAFVSYFNKNNQNHPVRPSREQIFLMPFCILFKKHSCLTKSVNKQINAYITSGLLQIWIRQYKELRYLNLKPEYHRSGNRPLEMAQLEGTFTYCLCLLGFSCIVFMCEILSKKMYVFRGVIEFLIYE